MSESTVLELKARVDVLSAALREIVRRLPQEEVRELTTALSATCVSGNVAVLHEAYDAAAAGEVARLLGASLR